MSDFKAFAGYRIHIVAIQLVCRCETDGVYETVEFFPGFAQFSEHGVDAGVFSHIALQDDVGTQLSCKFFHAAFQFVVLVGERQFSSLAVHRLSDTVGDGQFTGKTGHQNALTGKKTHSFNPYSHYLFFLAINAL
ncbi:hypothetical protein D3C73_1251070 [compost metagenome]